MCLWETKGINRTSACKCLGVCVFVCELSKNNKSFRSKNKTLGKQHLSTPRRVARRHPRALLTTAVPPAAQADVPDHPKRALSARWTGWSKGDTRFKSGWVCGDALFKVYAYAHFRTVPPRLDIRIPSPCRRSWRDRWLPCHVLFLLRLLQLLLSARSVISPLRRL